MDNKKIQIIALLKANGQTDNWNVLLKEKRVGEMLEKYLSFDDVNNFKSAPITVSSFQTLMRYFLEKILNLQASESSRLGLQIGNLLKNTGNPLYNKYNQAARFNVEKREFEWQ